MFLIGNVIDNNLNYKMSKSIMVFCYFGVSQASFILKEGMFGKLSRICVYCVRKWLDTKN